MSPSSPPDEDGSVAPWRRRRLWPALLAAAVLAALALGLAACGVPTEGTPRAISKVPPHLLTAQSPPTSSPAGPKYTVPVQIYLMRAGAYVTPVQRDVQPPGALKTVLQLLVTGPTTGEASQGYATALDPTVKVLSTTLANGVATVDFNKAFRYISSNLVLAVAQVVYTVTKYEPTVTGVSFQVDGQRQDVPIGTGYVVPGPVTLTQYAAATKASAPPTTAPLS